MKKLNKTATVCVLCGVATFVVVFLVTTCIIPGLFSIYTPAKELNSTNVSLPESTETKFNNETALNLPADDLVYVNEVAPTENSTSNWVALGEFTPMTKQEVLDYFGINTDFDALISNLHLQEMTTQHGFHSKLDGTLIPKDSFAYHNEEEKTSVIISIQDKSVPKYRLFELTENSIHSSTIAGSPVIILGWHDEKLQAYCCEFDLGNTFCFVETRNLSLNEVVEIVKLLLS